MSGVNSRIARRLLVVLAVIGMSVLIRPGEVWAEEVWAGEVWAEGDSAGMSPEVSAIISAELAANPGGVVDGHQIHYGDGLTFVAVEAGTLSLTQCPSGSFCGWAQANFSGSFYSTSGSAVTKTLSWTARSYANNRSQASRLYNSSATASTCFVPGRTRATIKSTYYAPARVYLSASTSC